MINKVVPRKLNQSSDSKIRSKEDMIDALNVSISSDERNSEGNEGVIKPVKSNVNISGTAFDSDGSKTVLGKLEDTKNDVVYFFVHCTDQNKSGVYAYDPNNYFTGHNPDEIIELFTNAEFNFDQTSFVKGDVTYIQTKREHDGVVYEDTPFLFFTDNINEPRKLNVLRAYYEEFVQDYVVGTNSIKDFITACPKAPSFPITFEFVADENLPYSEFRNINGFQFAYQMVYKDQNVSAISTISEIAVPPSYITHGASELPMPLNQHNVCRLTIPIDDMSFEVEKVKILARRGNDGQFFEIQEVDTTPAGITLLGVPPDAILDFLQNNNPLNLGTNTELVFDFKNDTVNKIVSSEDQSKQFDALPKRAEAQSIVDNRLFYGNYVEGFDNVETDATITPVSFERSLDFTDYELKVVPATCASEVFAKTATEDQLSGPRIAKLNKNSAFVLDPVDIPEVGVEAGDKITFSFSITPKQNWHVYNVEDDAGDNNILHNTQQLGDFFNEPFPPPESGNPNYVEELGAVYTKFWQKFAEDEPEVNDIDQFSVRDTDGVSRNSSVDSAIIWKNVDGSSRAAVYGTCVSNPLIIKGGEVSISIVIQATTTVSRTDIVDYITHLITGEDLPAGLSSNVFTVLTNNINNTYTFDLGFDNVSGEEFSMSSQFGKLITVCGDPTTAGTSGKQQGCFIVDKATVEIGFFKDSLYNEPLDSGAFRGEGSGWDNDSGQAIKRRIGIYIKSITEATTKTCLRNVVVNSPWKAVDFSTQFGFFTPALDIGPANIEDSTAIPEAIAEQFTEAGPFTRFIGRLQGFNFNGEDSEGRSRFSCLDGLGGLGGSDGSQVNNLDPASPFFGVIDSNYDEVKVLLGFNELVSNFTSGFGGELLGSAQMRGVSQQQIISGAPRAQTGAIIDNTFPIMPFTRETPNNDSLGIPESFTVNVGDGFLHFSGFINLVPSFFNITFFTELQSDSSFRSFKSGASHAFGVVYYDQRGRCSNVYPIGTALSPPYYLRQNDQYGRVAMQIQMNHDAPDYAEAFQIVYAGNTSVSDFVQYSTAGAYVAIDDNSENKGNIFVSLNHLQVNEDVSYTEARGNRSPEGARDIYTYKEGDILRVISYYESSDPIEGRIFVDDSHDFEVLDYRVLGADPEENPLYDSNITDLAGDSFEAHKAKQGAFLVLKNNPTAVGFNFESVKAGEGAINAQSHNWNKRTIVEIFSPKDVAAEDELFFYETSNVFPISEHNNQITINNGDVWWRKVAVNMPNLSGPSNLFTSIIGNPVSSGGDGSEANFVSYSLETQAFNDSVRNADVTGKGKTKVIVPNDQEVRRTASISFSDKNNPASKLFTITSFNPIKAQFKDLPAAHGNINYLVDQQDSLFVLQSDRSSSVPVNRNIITTASNDQSLVAASNVLGVQRYYAGQNGCDDNPESVCVVGNNIYFANKTSREVYKFNPSSGVSVISEQGMKSFFRLLFKELEDQEGLSKVVGGYDPIKDEFILSVYKLNVTEDQEVVEDPPDVGTPAAGAQTLAEVLATEGISLEELASILSELSLISNVDQENLNRVRFNFNNDSVVGSVDLLAFLAVLESNVETNDTKVQIEI